MKTLVLERSTDTQSVALAMDDGRVVGKVFTGMDSRSADWPVRVRGFLADMGLSVADVDRVLVGQGPGSFAGIRAALAFAQGLALPGGKPVVGLPSPMALTRGGSRTAVVGDARRGRYWVVLHDGVDMVGDFALATKETLAQSVPDGYSVVTPDGDRMDAILRAAFAQSYAGACAPLAERLAEISVDRPDLLRPEPLPIYLQPAVRPPEGR